MTDSISINRDILRGVYTDAILCLKALKDDGRLSQAEFDSVMGTTKHTDILAIIIDKMANVKSSPYRKKNSFQLIEPLLLQLGRFGSAIDVLAQSFPSIWGLNLVGLLWGSLKLLIILVHDSVETFDAVLGLLNEIMSGLPVWETYSKIFGSSDIKLIEIPLTKTYGEVIKLGIRAIELFDQSNFQISWRFAWKSLRSDFQLSIERIRAATAQIDRIAHAEHMHESHQALQVQQQEIVKLEAFHDELRTFFMTQANSDNNSWQPKTRPFNDAPLDMLSVNFSGRVNELEKLKKNLRETTVGQPSRCAIYGMPGLGKTQLALQYTRVFFDSYANARVFWIPASSIEQVNQGFSKILNLVDHPDRRHPEQSARQIAVRRWLEDLEISGPIRWLLILDNVNINTLEFLRKHLPRHGKQGQILFTSRIEDVAKALCETGGQKFSTIDLTVLDVPDATKLFFDDSETHSGHESSSLRNKVVELVKYLGCLPFAINQAASLMKQSYQSVDYLLESIHKDEKKLILDWENDLSSYETKSITATFIGLFDELRRLYPEANKLLKLLSFFDQESIKLDMLIQGAPALLSSHESTLPEPLITATVPATRSRKPRLLKKLLPERGKRILDTTPTATPVSISVLHSAAKLLLSPQDLNAAIQQMQRHSLIKRRTMVEGGALNIHDLVQSMIQEVLKTEGARTLWFKGAVTIACEAFRQIEDSKSPKCWEQCEKLIPHINSLAIWDNYLQEGNTELLQANDGVASYLAARGRYKEAQKLYQEVLIGSEKQIGHDHKTTLSIVLSLAQVFWDLGIYDDALGLYDRALKVHETKLGQDDTETLIVVEKMANIRRSQGRFDTAEALYNRVLQVREVKLGSEHPDTLQTLHNLAHVHRSQGRYHEAELLYRRALLGREKTLGHDHLETLWTADGLGKNYLRQLQYDKAIALFNRVLTSRETQLGADHPHTLWTADNIANAYCRVGRYTEAEELYDRVLLKNEVELGPNHQETLWTVHGLADVYLHQGRLIEAKAFYERALKGREKRLGPEHHLTLKTAHSLAGLFQKEDNYLEAEKLCLRALSGRKAKLRLNHPHTLRTLNDLGNIYEHQKRYDEAESCYKQALEGINNQSSISEIEIQDITQSLERVVIKKGQENGAT